MQNYDNSDFLQVSQACGTTGSMSTDTCLL